MIDIDWQQSCHDHDHGKLEDLGPSSWRTPAIASGGQAAGKHGQLPDYENSNIGVAHYKNGDLMRVYGGLMEFNGIYPAWWTFT